MTIHEASSHFQKMFGERGIHLSLGEHSMTVCIQDTDISGFEILEQLKILRELGVEPDGRWKDEFFFKDIE